MSNVTVTMSKTPKPVGWRRRHQPWRWTATAANGNTLAVGSEAYTNRKDCEDAILALFGCGTSVIVVCGGESWQAR